MSYSHVLDRIRVICRQCTALFLSATDLEDHSPLRFQYHSIHERVFSRYVMYFKLILLLLLFPILLLYFCFSYTFACLSSNV